MTSARQLAESATEINACGTADYPPKQSLDGAPSGVRYRASEARNTQFTVKFMVFEFVPPPYIPPVVRTYTGTVAAFAMSAAVIWAVN